MKSIADTIKRTDTLVPLLLIVIVLMIYLPGFLWGMPSATSDDHLHAWGNDDQVPLAPLAEMHNTFFNAKPDRNIAYPWFHYFLVASAYAPYLLYVYFSGGIDIPGAGYPVYPYGLEDPVAVFHNLTIIGRSVTLLLAIAVVLGVYFTAKNLWNNKAGFIAALFSLLMYPMAYYAKLGNVDVPVLGWTSLGLAVYALALRRGLSVWRGIWLGVFIALAISTKDQATGSFVFLIPVLFWLQFSRRIERTTDMRNRLWAAPLALIIGFLAVYILASGIPVDPQRYVLHVEKTLFAGTTRDLYLRYPATPAGLLAQSGDIFLYLVEVMSWPVLLAAVIGIGLVAIKDRLALTLLLSSLGFYLMLLPVGFTRIHYLLPVALPLMPFAGYAFSRGLEAKFAFKIVTLVLLIGSSAYLLLQTVDLTHDMVNDSRYDASSWLHQNSQPGEKLIYFGYPSKLPHIPDYLDEIRVQAPEEVEQTILSQQPEFIIDTTQDIDGKRQRIQWRYGPHSVYSPILPKDVFARLTDGSLGYRLVAQFQTPRLFPWLNRPFLSYPTVNPPVLIFARQDIAQEYPALEPWQSAPYYPKLVRVKELTVDEQ